MISTKNLYKRVISYCLGLLFLAFGVTFSVRSNLGVSPVNSIPYVLSICLGMDQGGVTTGVFCFYVLLQYILLGKEMKPIYLLQIVFASLFGYFVTFSNHIWLFLPMPEHYIVKIAFLCISMAFVAVGIMLYLSADIVPMPSEGVMLAIQTKTGIAFPKIKVMFDSTAVLIAILISFIGFGELRGIREGTVIAAICIGKLVGILNKKYKTKIEAFLHT